MRPRLGGAERAKGRGTRVHWILASMRPRLGGAERQSCASPSRPPRALQCGRAWGARRGPRVAAVPIGSPRFNAAAPGGRGEAIPSAKARKLEPSLQCGRAWGARRGPRHAERRTSLRRFNAAAPGGRGEVDITTEDVCAAIASMRPRLGGAEREPYRAAAERLWELQCGRAWGARRGPGWSREDPRTTCFNAAAPGGRGEAGPAAGWRAGGTRFNAAAPGGRGEAACPGCLCRIDGTASMRPRLGGAERQDRSLLALLVAHASMRPRLGGAERCDGGAGAP